MNTQDNRFLVSVERRDGGVYVVEARPIRMEEDSQSGPGLHVRNVSSHSYSPEPLADLLVSAQGSSDEMDRPYAWSVEYESPYRVDLARAEVMVKTLRKVERGLRAIEEQVLRPESFAAYLVRVGRVLGVDTFGYRTDERSNGWSYDHHEYRWVDAAGIASWIPYAVRKLYEREEATR